MAVPSAATLGVSVFADRGVTVLRPLATGGVNVNWTTVIRSVQFTPSVGAGTSWATSGSRRVVFTAFDSIGRESLPASLLICGGSLDCPPWVDLNGADPGVDVGDIVATEDGPPALLGLNSVYVWLGSGRQISGAKLQVTRAVNQPYELISCSLSALGGGSTSFYDVGAAELTITGAGSPTAYASVLRTCAYQNTADQPTVNVTRAVTVTLSSGAATSPMAVATVTILGRNDAPKVSDLAPPHKMTVQQGIPRSENNGVTAAELIGDVVFHTQQPSLKYTQWMHMFESSRRRNCRAMRSCASHST